MKVYLAACKDHEFFNNPGKVMRFFQEGQEDGGHQANGKDPPRSVIFSLQSSSPNSSRRASDEHLSTRWARKGRETTCVPVPGMGSLGDLDTVQSWSRETRQFVSITAMHGVKRIWESKGRSKVFWGVTVIVLATLMFWQAGLLLSTYLGKPTVSQVSLVMSEQGMDFPKITLCNYNPVKQSYLQSINSTGDFSPRLVQYLLLANSDAYDTITSNKTELEEDEAELEAYQAAHPGFTVDQFYEKGGFNCPELLKHCSFAGRDFDCCSVSRPVLTAHGLCHYINLRGAGIEGMTAQKESSETAGLQLILDARRDEKITEESASASLANPIDAGFRFYVDEPETSTYSTSQGISVSPGDVVYTAVSLVKYNLLDESSWGNCTSTWPAGYTGNNTKLKYQSKDCLTKCKARYFNENCGCSPFIYNIDGEYTSCSALQYYECLDNLVVKNGSLTEWPTCGECKSECNRWIYGTSNSYAHGFSDAAIASLRALYPEDNEEYIRANYLSVSIFFRDLSFTEYSQVAATNLTSLLSNMGGTLGLFLGMSVLTVFESIIYCAKVLWTFVSGQRRKYTAEKEREVKMSRNETERTFHCIKRLSVKNLDELARSMKADYDTDSFSYTRQNSWNTLTEKDSPGPFITIPMPPAP